MEGATVLDLSMLHHALMEHVCHEDHALVDIGMVPGKPGIDADKMREARGNDARNLGRMQRLADVDRRRNASDANSGKGSGKGGGGYGGGGYGGGGGGGGYGGR